jgi:Domain of unknown function (DUF6950)
MGRIVRRMTHARAQEKSDRFALDGEIHAHESRLRRKPDWEANLAAWARSMAGKPLVYGETDCTNLVFQAIDAMAGSTLADHWHWQWRNDQEGIDYMIRRRTHIVRELHALGIADVRPQYRQPGDIIICEDMSDGIPRSDELRRELGIGFMRCHICLGTFSIGSQYGVGVCLFHTAPIIGAAGHRHHVLRLPL